LRARGEPVRANAAAIATYAATGLVERHARHVFEASALSAAATMHVRTRRVRTVTYWDLPIPKPPR